MRRAVAGFRWSPTSEGGFALIVTTIFFAFGGLAGCLLAFWSADTGMEAMSAYLDCFLLSAKDGTLTSPVLWELLWRSLRWPLAAFVFGYTALGVIFLPAITALRGFYLAFSIAAFALSYGRTGLWVAFLLLGIPALSCVPAFMMMAVQSFSAACLLWRSGKRDLGFSRDCILRCGVCAAAVCVGILSEKYLVPALITSWAGVL